MEGHVKAGRIVSIDILRGFDMFWIIGGAVIVREIAKVWPDGFTRFLEYQTHHPSWVGYRFIDLIMPLFLFIVGAAIPFSLLKRKEKGQSSKTIYLHVFRRWGLLFFLGMIMTGLLKFNFGHIYYTGVLQKIGWTYLFTALIVLNTPKKIWWYIVPGCFIVYWLISSYVPVPGIGAGIYTPEKCLHTWVDQKFLPGEFNPKFYGHGSANGILGTFGTVGISLAGVLAGCFIKDNNRSGNSKALRLLGMGIAVAVLGYLFWYSGLNPSIKMIWSSSYSMISLGYSLMLLGVFYWVVDVKGWKKWGFGFMVIGMNPLFIYFIQAPVNFSGIAKYFVGGIADHSGIYKGLILLTSALGLKLLLLWYLYVKKIFIKV
jgi:predicted acyltransferase